MKASIKYVSALFAVLLVCGILQRVESGGATLKGLKPGKTLADVGNYVKGPHQQFEEIKHEDQQTEHSNNNQRQESHQQQHEQLPLQQQEHQQQQIPLPTSGQKTLLPTKTVQQEFQHPTKSGHQTLLPTKTLPNQGQYQTKSGQQTSLPTKTLQHQDQYQTKSGQQQQTNYATKSSSHQWPTKSQQASFLARKGQSFYYPVPQKRFSVNQIAKTSWPTKSWPRKTNSVEIGSRFETKQATKV